jgi:endoglucanase
MIGLIGDKARADLRTGQEHDMTNQSRSTRCLPRPGSMLSVASGAVALLVACVWTLGSAQADPIRHGPFIVAQANNNDGPVRLSTTESGALLNQGDTISHTLELPPGASGKRVRIQNSNHGANYFTTPFGAAVQAAVASIPGASATKVTEQQMEITLPAAASHIVIVQTVTKDPIPGTVDDASWAPGTQLQVDWLLSSAPTNGAPVAPDGAVDSKWISYGQANTASAQPSPPAAAAKPTQPSDARWTLLRSSPAIASGEKVTFEIDKTNYVLTSPVTLKIGVDGASSAADKDFVKGLKDAITSALDSHVRYDAPNGTLTFDQATSFPFTFSMTAGQVSANKDYVLHISDSQIGQIDVGKAGVRLGTLSQPAIKPLMGVNQASGEFGVGPYAFKYAYPGKDRISWAAAQGFGIIRVPFLFQNVQPASGAPLNEGAARQLDLVMNECAMQRVICLLDLHSYGTYYGDDSTATALPGTPNASNGRLGEFWAQIARRYKDNSFVWLGLMNEPNKQTALEWVKTTNAIAAAIRATGATNKIVFPGTAWDGAWHWTTSGNAVQMLKAYDPGNNFAFEGHQYLDADGSGTSPNCAAGSGARLAPFTTWLKTHKLQGIIGEVGWAANGNCATEATALLDSWKAAAIDASGSGYIGMTYWANGPWWPDSYMYLAEPRPFPSGAEPEQLKLLKRYITR